MAPSSKTPSNCSQSRPRHLRQGLEDLSPLGMQRHADGRGEDQTAVTQHLDVESKAGVAWVPARPKRRVGLAETDRSLGQPEACSGAERGLFRAPAD